MHRHRARNIHFNQPPFAVRRASPHARRRGARGCVSVTSPAIAAILSARLAMPARCAPKAMQRRRSARARAGGSSCDGEARHEQQHRADDARVRDVEGREVPAPREEHVDEVAHLAHRRSARAIPSPGCRRGCRSRPTGSAPRPPAGRVAGSACAPPARSGTRPPQRPPTSRPAAALSKPQAMPGSTSMNANQSRRSCSAAWCGRGNRLHQHARAK